MKACQKKGIGLLWGKVPYMVVSYLFYYRPDLPKTYEWVRIASPMFKDHMIVYVFWAGWWETIRIHIVLSFEGPVVGKKNQWETAIYVACMLIWLYIVFARFLYWFYVCFMFVLGTWLYTFFFRTTSQKNAPSIGPWLSEALWMDMVLSTSRWLIICSITRSKRWKRLKAGSTWSWLPHFLYLYGFSRS